ncbi:MAG: HD domain-containing protein [archaeon]|nr:MAG: HD domain-containing protein [archaeon]
MEGIYLKIWELARPYYEKGRSYDVPHIEWMMKESDKVSDMESLDKKLLMPISILHDVGYSIVDEKNPNIKRELVKKLHMQEGAKISKKILYEAGYDPEYSEKIVHYISVHDNWVLGDDTPYKECKEMAVFNDLDFLWVTKSFENFKTAAESMKMTPEDFYEFWTKDEKLTRRPFCCEYTRSMWESSIKKIKESLKI